MDYIRSILEVDILTKAFLLGCCALLYISTSLSRTILTGRSNKIHCACLAIIGLFWLAAPIMILGGFILDPNNIFVKIACVIFSIFSVICQLLGLLAIIALDDPLTEEELAMVSKKTRKRRSRRRTR